MRRTNLYAVLVVVLVGLLAAGCAKPPQQEIDAAKAAMAAAEGEASKWAPDAWAKVSDAMNQVNAELQAQEGKFSLFRSYNHTKELLTSVTSAVDAAKQAAAANKEQAKKDAEAAIAAAQGAVKGAEDSMKALDGCKRKPKGFQKDMEMTKSQWDGLNSQLAGLDAQMKSEDYKGAKAAADSLKASADALAKSLGETKTKIKC